jgi:hypothetical protein
MSKRGLLDVALGYSRTDRVLPALDYEITRLKDFFTMFRFNEELEACH